VYLFCVISSARYYSDLQEKEILPSVPFSRIIFNFLGIFFCEQTNTTAAPHIILIFFCFGKKHSIFVRIIWKLIS